MRGSKNLLIDMLTEPEKGHDALFEKDKYL
jgi:hypothetical protein